MLRLKARATCLKVWAVVGSFFDSPEHLRAPTGADVHQIEMIEFLPALIVKAFR
tara:strand:- start:244 stop:405 length:162 start_codon:yes stop_codon:yes gene_type:complete